MSTPDFEAEARELFDSMSNERDEWTRNNRIKRIAAALSKAYDKGREDERQMWRDSGR